MIDLDDLRKKAEAVIEDDMWPFAAKAYANATGPVVILELLDRLEKAESEVTRFEFMEKCDADRKW